MRLPRSVPVKPRSRAQRDSFPVEFRLFIRDGNAFDPLRLPLPRKNQSPSLQPREFDGLWRRLELQRSFIVKGKRQGGVPGMSEQDGINHLPAAVTER